VARGRLSCFALAASVLAASALVGACSDGVILASDAQQLYVRLPSGWHVYGARAVEAGNSFFSAMSASPEQYFEGAVAGPRPHPSAIWSPSAYPWAIVEAQGLTSGQQLQMSVEGLSNVLIPIDSLAEQGAEFQQLSQPQAMVRGRLRGSLVSFEYGTGPDTAFDYEQATWVNNPTTKAWVLIVGCSPTCYQLYRSTLGRVVNSFYVGNEGT